MKKPTKYAPAEISTQEEVRRQYNNFFNNPFLQELLEAVPDIYLILNKNRQIVYYNQALLDFFSKKKAEDIIGKQTGDVVGCIRTENGAACGTSEFCRTCGAVQAILSSLKGNERVQECRIVRRSDQEAMDIKVWTRPLDVEGERFVVFVITDISDEKRRQALEHIFFHDVMNTVSGLTGLTELLRIANKDEMGELLELTTGLVNRLTDELMAQRDLIMAENNELHVRPIFLEPRRFLSEIIDTYRNHDAAKNRRLELDPKSDSQSFSSDPNLLRRVIGNMVKNALEASDPGDVITLAARANKAEHEIELSVHNSNYIPRKVQLQIFQRSFSTKGIGRGLGAYSMKLLGERYLKGNVSFTSTIPDGTTFRFTVRY